MAPLLQAMIIHRGIGQPMNKYADATLMDLTRLADASNRLYNCIAEFPDDPEYWGDALEFFDTAVESCPGTAAHYHKQQQPKG